MTFDKYKTMWAFRGIIVSDDPNYPKDTKVGKSVALSREINQLYTMTIKTNDDIKVVYNNVTFEVFIVTIRKYSSELGTTTEVYTNDHGINKILENI